eukprot:2489767-Pyramimonas_sp.AAC.1
MVFSYAYIAYKAAADDSRFEICSCIFSYAMAYEFTYIEGGAAMGPMPNLPPSIAWNKLGQRQQDRIDNGEDSGSVE